MVWWKKTNHSLKNVLRIYVVTDRTKTGGKSLSQVIKYAVKFGATAVQLREKDLSARELFEIAKDLRKITSNNKVAFIINNHVDIALAVGADGIHLGKDSLPIDVIKRIKTKNMFIGVSCHSLDEVIEANNNGVDYVILGPIFNPLAKKSDIKSLGIETIKKAKSRISIPIIAIGGITEENCNKVINAGADGVAGITSFMSGDNKIFKCLAKENF